VLRALSRRGAQVDLFAARLDGDRPEGLENVRLHKLSMFGKELLSDDTSMLRANRELRRMLNSTRGRAFDVILERFSPWCYAGVEQARASGIPCLLETTEYGIEEQMKLPEDVRRISQETLEGATRLVS
jgi:predicted transcriptional regulator